MWIKKSLSSRCHVETYPFSHISKVIVVLSKVYFPYKIEMIKHLLHPHLSVGIAAITWSGLGVKSTTIQQF